MTTVATDTTGPAESSCATRTTGATRRVHGHGGVEPDRATVDPTRTGTTVTAIAGGPTGSALATGATSASGPTVVTGGGSVICARTTGAAGATAAAVAAPCSRTTVATGAAAGRHGHGAREPDRGAIHAGPTIAAQAADPKPSSCTGIATSSAGATVPGKEPRPAGSTAAADAGGTAIAAVTTCATGAGRAAGGHRRS